MHHISSKNDVNFVFAILNKLPSEIGAILYSDQGFQYINKLYQEVLKEKISKAVARVKVIVWPTLR